MNLLRSFFKNFAHPQGFLGRVVAFRLNISNREANEWTLSLLDIQPADHILEIGFGSGLTLQKAARLTPKGRVAGIDSSLTMLDIAAKRNRALIAAGRMELKSGEMAALPYPDGSFDKIYAVQVINYLPNLLAGLREARRVLKPGGRAALFFEPKEKFEGAGNLIAGIYKPYSAAEIEEALRWAGFAHTWSETIKFRYSTGICVLGEKETGWKASDWEKILWKGSGRKENLKR